jgi:hypothetical protein
MAKLHDFQRPSARQIRDADLFFDDLIGRTRGREALTEQVGPSAATVTPFMILDRLAFDNDDFLADHRAGITRVAHLIVDSIGTGAPITTVRIVGHTDSQGQATHNNGLGRRRATKVAAFLRTEIDGFRAGTSSSITITPDTEGSRRPAASNATATGRARNRRVEIFVDSTCQAFLCQYDLRTLPSSADFGVPANPTMTAAEKIQRESDVRAFAVAPTQELINRRTARVTAAMTGTTGTVPAGTPVPTSLRPAAERLSEAQLALFREFMPNGSGGIDLPRAQTCFELFANGEVRSTITASIAEPNGDFFFLFAEWALLCIDSSIDAAAWTDLLRIFVMMQEPFIAVYRPPATTSAPPRLLSTFSYRNFNAAAQLTATQKAALRTRYASMNLAALGRAYRDNLRRAITMP